MSTEYMTKRIYTVEIEKSEYIKLKEIIEQYEKKLNTARERYHKKNGHDYHGRKHTIVPSLKVTGKRTDKFKVCLKAINNDPEDND